MGRRYVILGASAAGVGAAERLRDLDSQATITVVGGETHYAYYRPLLPYLIDGRKSLDDISFHPPAWYAEKRIRLVLGVAGFRIEADRKVVELEDGRRYDYDALLLAVGASSRIPSTPGITATGARPVRTVDDVRALGERARETEAAVLMGGGLVSLKSIEPLLRMGLSCTVVIASPHVLSRVLDAPAAALVAERLLQQGVKLVYGHEVAQLAADSQGRVTGAVLDTGETLPCGLVVVGKGVRPNLETASRSGLASHWGISVGPYLETTDPDVFAAGDCVETVDLVTGGQQVAALWTNAVSMAHVAAHNMVHGHRQVYRGVIGTMNSTVLFGLPFVALGLTDPVSEQYQRVAAHSVDGGRYRKLVFDGDRLVGAVFAGDVARTGVYRAFIDAGAPLTGALRRAAEEDRLTYADLSMRGRPPVDSPYVGASTG